MTTTTWTRYSQTTWDSIGWTVSPGVSADSWTVMHDLEHEMADLTGLDVKTCQVLLTAAKCALPVQISWETTGGARVERHTGAAMIDSVTLLASRGGIGYADRMRLRYLGFSHDVYLYTLRSASLLGMELTFLDVEPCVNPWHESAPARRRMRCPECPEV